MSSSLQRNPQESVEYPSLRLLKHPLINHKLTLMRDRFCSAVEFHALMKEIGMFLAFEVTRDLPTTLRRIEVSDALATRSYGDLEAPIMAGQNPVLVPILRAGLVLAEGVRAAMPSVSTGHIGLQRHRESPEFIEYLVALPDPEDRIFILIDPVVGTGNAACRAIEVLLEYGVSASAIRFVTLLISPEGAKLVADRHPDVPIYAVSLEQGLDARKYIVPGFGHATDRLFSEH